jgi:tRNA A37 threonylcarbamoyladenosine modification protein TsaB
MSSRTSEGDFLEWLQPAVSGVLTEHGLELADLSALYFGSGPGSTLGLRLAALFIRTLLQTSKIEGIPCYQYQNLEAATCAFGGSLATVAPWRRDRLHLCEPDQQEGGFHNSGIEPAKAVSKGFTGVILGRRMHQMDKEIDWRPFPFEKLPAVLHKNPSLLKLTANPAPYSVEIPEFVKWNPKRHSAK